MLKGASEDLEGWFMPVVQKILEMLGEQMRQSQMQNGRAINVRCIASEEATSIDHA